MSQLTYRNIIIAFVLFILAVLLFGINNLSLFKEKQCSKPEHSLGESLRVSSQNFGTVKVTPDLILEGQGENIDSPELYEDGENTLLFVSGKDNDLIEVWQYPFKDRELPPIERDSLPNGLGIDQDDNLLLVGDSDHELVEVFSIPEKKVIREIGEDTLKSGETNLDVLTLPSGKKSIYATESKGIRVFDLETGKLIHSFSPEVQNIEEVAADSYHQIIYVPDENGSSSKENPGGAITAYTPEGKPYLKNDSSVFGQGLFSEDGEGITIYTCRNTKGEDNGNGFIIASDQRTEINDYEFFDRQTWEHLGTLQIEGVSFTDGITSTSIPLPDYPKGIFAAVNNDKNTALVSWERIEAATNLSCK